MSSVSAIPLISPHHVVDETCGILLNIHLTRSDPEIFVSGIDTVRLTLRLNGIDIHKYDFSKLKRAYIK